MTDCWHNCFETGWRELLVEEAFSHPAKFAHDLIFCILKHAKEEGWVKDGDSVVDPFGGIACGGLACGYRGLKWFGCELEPRFVGLANQNIAKHEETWRRLGLPVPVIFQGDSRKLVEVLREGRTAPVLSSPPYEESVGTPSVGRLQGQSGGTASTKAQKKVGLTADYGTTSGQIGSMPAGNIDAVLSSPPYADQFAGKHEQTETAEESRSKRKTKGGSLGQSERHGGYGTTDGNLGLLGDGDVDAVLSSPPYEGSLEDHSPGPAVRRARAGRKEEGKGYDTGNKENLGNETGETFWSAARDIVRQCHQILKPSGKAIWNTKDFVRNKKRVPFSDDWLRLCEACGFKLLCRHRAMLTKSTTITTFAGPVEKVTERKSFFRRLTEKHGSPKIDWEDVICMEKI